ncbi:glycosyltransferase family 2 protein [Pontibacter oryzae]|uniref:Glycosyltransferase family 2 protein n=1 Tax=Pontibacter oryzae TaxID=2304593 RepID=A0A399SIB6_9BACT|nr:glycosyltransferase family 2 protein [Pontibacter oryzae]RIJ41465.1 glycosyltransferase family 2 protein [Pontibacter oryzae]
MEISFVILTWNRYKFLEKCLEQLLSSIKDINQCEVVVMDNGSTDATAAVLEAYADNKHVKVITRDANYGLNAYKKLFKAAAGEYIVIVDDDVLGFPEGVDKIFLDYMKAFPDYGFLALNVIQNEFTNGAKPGPEAYVEETRDGKVIERGPTGGWCACFRAKEFRKIKFLFSLMNLNMKRSEDGLLAKLFQKRLGLKSGLIKEATCFHACGPYYAKEFGHLEREIEKYAKSGLKNFVDEYKKYI